MTTKSRAAMATLLLVAAAVGSASAQSGSGPLIEVPLRVEGGRLLVPVLASDGTELTFAVSTGNPTHVLAESVAARLGAGVSLSLGGAPLDAEGAHTVGDGDLRAGARKIDGMVGSSMLSGFDVLINAPGGRMLLKKIGPAVAWTGVTLSDPVRLRVYHGVVLSLDVELGGLPYRAALDLGMPTLTVNAPVRDALDLDAQDRASLRIGDVTFPDVPVVLDDHETFGRWDPDQRGFVYVGAPIAHDCAIAISWAHQELRTCVR